MSRSPLAYPLNRGIDGDAGGAADLQTDIMRFMAILALCLVAIFALVQSIPMAPKPIAPEPAAVATVPTELSTAKVPPVETAVVVTRPDPVAVPEPASPEPEAVVLTRPKWQPLPQPQPADVPEATPAAPAEAPRSDGFTLRFESDLALTRLVASSQVGFYAITGGQAQRMTVSDSRISFWDASSPNAFHEMESSTVPDPVVDALKRSGADATGVSWGVTLPGKLSRQLDKVMRENNGGSLVIGLDGQLRLEKQ